MARAPSPERPPHESETWLHAVVDFIPEAAVGNFEGKCVYANLAACKLIGTRSVAELVGRDVLDLVAPEQRELVAASVERVLTGGVEAPQKFVLVRADGRSVEVECASTRVELNGRSALLMLLTDISERNKAEEALRESEADFRALAESMPQIVWACRPDGANYYFNHQWVDYTGMTLEESHGPGWNQPFHPDDQQRAWEAWQNATQNHVPYSLECRLRRADGVYRWWLIRGAPLRNAGGKVLKWFGTCTDIQEIKETQAALENQARLLREGHDLLANLTRLVPGVVYQYRLYPDGRSAFPYASPGMSDIYEVTPEEVREDATPVFGRLHPEDYDHVAACIQESARTLSTFYCEFRVILPRQGLRWRWSQAHPERTADGGTLWHGIISDITERKQAEEELREGQERYRQLLESAHDWIWETDEHDVYTSASPKVFELLGYEPEEVLGKTPFDLMPPDEAARVAEVFATMTGGRKPFRDLPNLNLHRDGHFVFLESSGVPVFDSRGEYRGYRGMDRDVSERMRLEEARAESERMLATLMANLPGMAYRCLNDDEWTELFLSDGCETLTGYKPADLMGNARVSYADLIHPDDREMVWREIQAGVSAREPFRVLYRIVTAGGETKWVWEQGQGVFDGGDAPLYLEGLITDITERVCAEQALRAAEEQLRQAQKMEAVGQLAGGIAHDFNNLLAVILGYSDLLLAGDDLPDSARQEITQMRKAADRAGALTKQILAFSRRQALRPKVVSLNVVLDGMEPLLRRTLGEHIDLASRQDAGLGLVEADVHQFEQVVMNLAINARDAMISGGRLTLETANVELDEEYCRTHPEATPGSYVMLAVSDTGMGMDDLTREHIFEPFFTTKELGVGTGLGLATVYGIVKQSHGTISVESELGQGASFKIYLPRFMGHVQEEAPETAGTGSARGEETVLLVEDEVPLRDLVVRVLGGLGYRVLAAGTAADALEAVREAGRLPDLLLTDVVLPGGVQGHELARDLSCSQPDLPVLYVSGYPRNAIVHSGQLDAGVNFLEKPFTPESLAHAVRSVLDQARR